MSPPRTFGPVLQARIQALRRLAAVAVSEVTGVTTAPGSYPRTIDIIRREPVGTADSARGLATAWSTVAGLDGLVGHVRHAGRWESAETGAKVEIRENQRIVLILDIPAAGNGDAGDLLLTDRLQFDDQTYGVTVWQILQVRVRKPDRMAWALCEWAREESV